MYPIVQREYHQAAIAFLLAGGVWTNQPYNFSNVNNRPSQIRTRPVPMTEEEVRTIRKETGKGPYFEKKFVPVAKGRPRSQTRRKK